MVRTCIEDFVGFKDEEETIIGRLTNSLMERDIISIIGMPGSGKTTLAKKVYDSPFVQRKFHKLAWYTVSQFYNRRESLTVILKAVGISDDEIEEQCTEEDLQRLLYQRLKGQRYLIVLDDIWDVVAWEELQQSFPDDENGSRIMLTSRYAYVASKANPNSRPHFLRPFSDEECWKLLGKQLFGTDACPPNLLGVGMQIVKKCKGLPLAVVAVAGLLAKEVKNPSWWEQIEESLGSHIAGTSCMEILELSYNHLPDFLKPCFLYFGAFQEDQEIDAKTLTLLWISEGFILNPGSKSLEEVAQGYLADLISRNLVLVSRKSYNGWIKECYVHDLILELCWKKAKEEKFMEVVRKDDIKEEPVGKRPEPTRYDKCRLSIQAHPSSFIDSSATSPCVRSIISHFSSGIFYYSNLMNLRNNFKSLEVLHLWFFFDRWQPYYSLPIELTSLVHLRYLALSCKFKVIPPPIANLKNLETFLVRNKYHVTCLPDTMWKMRRLRHVKISSAYLSSSDFMIPQSYQLDNIESFKLIGVRNEEDAKMLLRRIPRVRDLKVKIFKTWGNPLSVLGSLSKLEALTLIYIAVVHDHYLHKILPYPYAISVPSSLKKLSLEGLRRPWKEIAVIGRLPNLEVLKLSNYAFVGKIWDVEDEEFSNLKCLKLFRLDFKQWNASDDSFPCLRQLYVERCGKLEEIPTFGASSTLEMIHVCKCSHSATASARFIVEEQQELGNTDLEVHIN